MAPWLPAAAEFGSSCFSFYDIICLGQINLQQTTGGLINTCANDEVVSFAGNDHVFTSNHLVWAIVGALGLVGGGSMAAMPGSHCTVFVASSASNGVGSVTLRFGGISMGKCSTPINTVCAREAEQTTMLNYSYIARLFIDPTANELTYSGSKRFGLFGPFGLQMGLTTSYAAGGRILRYSTLCQLAFNGGKYASTLNVPAIGSTGIRR